MTQLLTPLTDDYLMEIAQYFSQLEVPYPAPAPTNASPALLQQGQRLVMQGDTARNIPACVQCHGQAMTGVAPNIPGLLGLPRDYLNAQLGAWMQWNYAQIARPTPQSLGYFLRVGVWFFWPAWPFAAWAVYAWRRQRRVLHIVVPVTFTGMATLLALFHPAPEQGQLLLLLPPLAIMAAFGLLTMKRGAINAIDWFSVMVLTLCAATLWLFWSAMLT
eukprot:gene11085-13550_t